MACILSVHINSEAQSNRPGEGVARQIQALRSLMASHSNALSASMTALDGDITALEGRVSVNEGDITSLEGDVTDLTTRVTDIEDTLNDHTRCFNRSTSSIYWPNHPSANARGCVRHTDLVAAPPPPVDPPANCSGATRTWGSGHCTGSHGPIPHGTHVIVSDPAPVGDICSRRYQYGGSIRATCNDGVVTYSNASCSQRDYYDEPTCRGSCFTADTQVLMADGREIDIHKVKIGDKLLGRDGAIHTVLDLDRPLLWKGKDQRLIEINGEKAFTTDNHPILTTDGWKAVHPDMAEKEAYDQLAGKIGKLEVGDTIIMAQGKRLKVDSIEIMPQEDREVRLYNLLLDGDHTYFANGMLVHGSVPDQGGKYPLAKDHNGEPE